MDDDTEQSSKPKVVGLYGLPGSGKTTLLRQIAEDFDENEFLLFEGSEKISQICPGGLNAFQKLNDPEKNPYREQAIKRIQQECIDSDRPAVVTGHFSFEANGIDHKVWTPADASVFTHIIYLDTTDEGIIRQKSEDAERQRDSQAEQALEAWKEKEKHSLRLVCYEHGILLSEVLGGTPDVRAEVMQLLRDFKVHSEGLNRSVVIERLNNILNARPIQLETVLVLDADKTLSPIDSGELFWTIPILSADQTPSHLFQSQGYSYRTFRQAMLLHQSFADEALFEEHCVKVARRVEIYPEFLRLLRSAAKVKSLATIIVTCGLSRVWSLVLEREGIAESVDVIGCGRVNNQFVVTPDTKRQIVRYLQHGPELTVWAFGDSPLDLPMLQEADRAVVVVGHESNRSKSMDKALQLAIDGDGFRARQVLLPANKVSPRLDAEHLPVVDFDELVAQEILMTSRGQLDLVDATDKTASKLLTRDMRDANIDGPALRDVHERAGMYLAMVHVSDIIGLERSEISHVQGGKAVGHRLLHEARTLIVACMRGGEPMALGVSKVFPQAAFFHADKASDLEVHALQGYSSIIIVDSVINEGRTIIEFVNCIREMYRPIRIIVVTGVAQAAAVAEDGPIARSLDQKGNLTIVALRISQNKYQGFGGTDTGNRLFNTIRPFKPTRLFTTSTSSEEEDEEEEVEEEEEKKKEARVSATQRMILKRSIS